MSELLYCTSTYVPYVAVGISQPAIAPLSADNKNCSGKRKLESHRFLAKMRQNDYILLLLIIIHFHELDLINRKQNMKISAIEKQTEFFVTFTSTLSKYVTHFVRVPSNPRCTVAWVSNYVHYLN